jgi:hypothetical protein
MAQTLLDGTTAAFNFQTDVLAADLTAANVSGGAYPATTSTALDSWKCMARYLSIDIDRALINRTTFCTAGWMGHVPALKNLVGRLAGFMSKGSSISNPLYMFGTTFGIPMIATLDTALTISALVMASRDHLGMTAMENSEREMTFESDGTYLAPAVSWT